MIAPRRLAFADLLFSWPPNGGADADLYAAIDGLRRAGHAVHLFALHVDGSTDRGIVDPAALPFPCTLLRLKPGALRPGPLGAAYRAAIDAWRPDLVFAMHGYALKPHLIAALAHHRPVARYYAHELACLRDALRFREGAPCPNDYLRTPETCRACALAGRAAEIRSGKPATWTADLLAANAFGPRYREAVIAGLRASRAVIVSNRALAAHLEGFHGAVEVITGGVRVADVPFAPMPARAPDAPMQIFMAGRAGDPLKGLAVLREAGRLLEAQRSGFHIAATHFDATLSGGRFEATGWLSHDETLARYAAADIVAVPSVWHEPFGLVAVEAMAAGRPVVASRCGGLQDIVVDGETGFLVPPGDAAALAERLGALLDDPALRARMGAAARRRAETEYDWDAVIARQYLPRIEAWTA